VLSPYKQQLDELRTQINRQLSKNNMVDEAVIKSIEINTVDGFQGREKNIIIFSCVRAAGKNFYCHSWLLGVENISDTLFPF
jgi:senataxin